MAQAGTIGSYGTFAIDSAGAWTYTANSAHNEFVAGTTYTDTFAVASADGTTTSVTINILGTNDAAVLSADVRNLTETDAAADISTSGTLTISDVDSPATFVAQAGTIGSYGTFAIDSAGAWTYTANSAHNEFVAGTTYTDTFAVASADGTTTSVTINILGTNDAAVLSADVSNLTETDTAADISTSGTLTISDVDSPASFVAQAGTAGSYGTFAIDSAGAWTYTASSEHNEFAAGTTYTDTFSVASADGTTHLGDHQHPRHQRHAGGERRCRHGCGRRRGDHGQRAGQRQRCRQRADGGEHHRLHPGRQRLRRLQQRRHFHLYAQRLRDHQRQLHLYHR